WCDPPSAERGNAGIVQDMRRAPEGPPPAALRADGGDRAMPRLRDGGLAMSRTSAISADTLSRWEDAVASAYFEADASLADAEDNPALVRDLRRLREYLAPIRRELRNAYVEAVTSDGCVSAVVER